MSQLTVHKRKTRDKVEENSEVFFDDVITQITDISKSELIIHQMKACSESYPNMHISL